MVTRKQEKGFVQILIVVLVIAVAGFFAFKYFQLKNASVFTPTPVTITSPSPIVNNNLTANWKTYSGSGYSFKYPAEYSLNETAMPYLNGKISWRYNNVSVLDCKGDCPFITSKTNTTLGGEPATKMIGYIGSEGGGVPQAYITYEVKMKFKYFVISIQALPVLTRDEMVKYNQSEIQQIKPSDLDAFTQILSTFKFTDTTLTVPTDWKTYVPVNKLYSVSYPADYIISTESSRDVIYISNKLPPDPKCTGGGCFLGTPRLTIAIDTIKSSLDLMSFAQLRNDNTKENWPKTSEIKETNMGSFKAYSYEGECIGYCVVTIVKPLQNVGFEITQIFPSKTEIPNYKSTADQILSTFKINGS